MSTLTYLTSLVQQAISRLNNYEANAKKVDELPHQTTLEPSSKIPVSRGGISEHVTVQQIISSIQNSNYNQLLAIGTISVSGTDITVPSGVSGQINGALYGTSTDTTIPITLCPAGFNRKDILVLTTSNTVIAISGEETDGAIVLAPPTPLDTIYITEFDVNDSSIGITVDPSIGTSFIEKSDFLVHNFVGSGSDVVIPLLANGASEIRLQSGLTPLNSIDGFDLSLITGNPDAKVPYNGKIFLIRNTASAPITLKNSGDADFKFYSLSSTDVVIPVNGTITVKYGFYGGESSFTEYFRNWTEPIDLSTKADLVGGKVPLSQLPAISQDLKILHKNHISGVSVVNNPNFTAKYAYGVLIPANTIQVGDFIDIEVSFEKISGGAADLYAGISINTINDYAGATNLSYALFGSNVVYAKIQRSLVVKNSAQTETFHHGTGSATSWNAATASGNKNINWSTDKYIVISINNHGALDATWRVSSVIITKK